MLYVIFVIMLVINTLAQAEDSSNEKIEGEIDASLREFQVCILSYTNFLRMYILCVCGLSTFRVYTKTLFVSFA